MDGLSRRPPSAVRNEARERCVKESRYVADGQHISRECSLKRDLRRLTSTKFDAHKQQRRDRKHGK
eukprot:6187264-Pleurochrysis_carterae.AAC.9